MISSLACMSITHIVSSKFSLGIQSSNKCGLLPTIHKSTINPSFRQNSNQKTFKLKTIARSFGPKREDDKEDGRTEKTIFGSEREDGKEDGRTEKTIFGSEREDGKEDGRTKKTIFGSEREDSKEDGRTEETIFSSESEDDKEDGRAEETVLKLYTDIKNQNIKGISDLIGDDCQCFCNFLSTYKLLQGKKQVLAFFYWLMKKLGKDIKIIVKPTSKDGMTVGLQWQLEWDKPQIRLGKGFSFHICHMYQGKLLIKNVEMFMEPIFHLEPLRLRTMAFAVRLSEKMITYLGPAGNTRRRAMTFLLLALLLLAGAAVYFTQPRF